MLGSSNQLKAAASPVRSALAGKTRTQGVQDRSTLEADAAGMFLVALAPALRPCFNRPAKLLGCELCSEMTVQFVTKEMKRR